MNNIEMPEVSSENSMKLDVKIISISESGNNPLATASVNMNNCFAVKNIRIMDGKKGLFVSMPNYKTANGEYKDICFPVTKEFREQLNTAVITAYEQKLEQRQTQENDMDNGMSLQ